MDKSKVKLTTASGEYEVDPERIATNEVTLPGEGMYRKAKLWVIGNEFGPMGAVWATNEQDALDELVDQDLGAGILVDEDSLASMSEEEQEELAHLGNASEPADLSYAWLHEVKFEPARDWYLLCKLAEARGAGADRLSDVL